jgi:hypothetical protein
LLAPDIMEAILAGSIDPGAVLEKLERPLPASWRSGRVHDRQEPLDPI